LGKAQRKTEEGDAVQRTRKARKGGQPGEIPLTQQKKKKASLRWNAVWRKKNLKG